MNHFPKAPLEDRVEFISIIIFVLVAVLMIGFYLGINQTQSKVCNTLHDVPKSEWEEIKSPFKCNTYECKIFMSNKTKRTSK